MLHMTYRHVGHLNFLYLTMDKNYCYRKMLSNNIITLNDVGIPKIN